MPKGKKGDREYQSVSLWDGDGDYFASGNIVFTPEFLEELLDKFDAEDPDVIDDYTGNIKVRITIRESEYDGTDYYGSVYIGEAKGSSSRRKKKTRSAKSRDSSR